MQACGYIAIHSKSGYFLTRATDGGIYVNSPTVYTRQRLVNDRLSQVRWLEEQLKVADGEAPNFRSIDEVHDSNSSLSVKAKLASSSSDQPYETPISDKPAADTSDLATSPAEPIRVVPTTTAFFRAKEAFREEVRGEMTEAQLDDRHDILGNTIYRLSFEASVIAGDRENTLAGIQVHLRHHPPVESIKGQKSMKDPDPVSRLYDEDYEQLYLDWIRYVQRLLSESVGNFSASLTTTSPDTRAKLLFSELLLERICQFVQGNVDMSDNIPCVEGGGDLGVSGKAFANMLIESYTASIFAKREQLSRDLFLKKIYPNLNKEYDLDKYSDDEWYNQARTVCEQNNVNEISVNLIGINYRSDNIEKKPYQIIGCPFYKSYAERFSAGVRLYEYVLSNSLRNTAMSIKDNDLVKLSERWQDRNQDVNLRADVDNLVEKWRDQSEKVGLKEAVTCFAADFIRANLDGFHREVEPWQKISHFLKIEIVGREAGYCDLLVSALPKPAPPDDKRYSPVEELEYYLNRSTEAFAYSVTPKNLSENISTGSETRDSYEMLLHAMADAKNSDKTINALRTNSDTIKAILAHPIVVGIGSGRPTPEMVSYRNDPTQYSSVVRDIKFGWVIAPQLQRGEGFQQINGQYALTAVISVPSWWRSAEVVVTPCWIKPNDVDGLNEQSGEICTSDRLERTREGNPEPTIVRLPGAISELSRKLGFEVVQEPYLAPNQAPQELEIGQPGALLLKGDRLWRSTEVTLGAQSATSITVLPNMEGIIAKFDCVLPQSISQLSTDPKTLTASPVTK